MWRVFPRVRAGWGEAGGRRPAGLFFLVLHFIRHGMRAAHVVDDGDAMEAGDGADEDGALGTLRGDEDAVLVPIEAGHVGAAFGSEADFLVLQWRVAANAIRRRRIGGNDARTLLGVDVAAGGADRRKHRHLFAVRATVADELRRIDGEDAG